MATLEHTPGTDPAVAAPLSELTHLRYAIAPDGGTVELSDRDFVAIQRGDYRPIW